MIYLKKKLAAVLTSDCEFTTLIEDVSSSILIYTELLFKWHKKINLTAKNTLEGIFLEHVLDSAYAARALPSSGVVVDVGSGAGLPGAVVSLVKRDLKVVLIEPKDKCCSFLKAVKRTLKCENLTILSEKIENLSHEQVSASAPELPVYLISRAFSPFNVLFSSLSGHLSKAQCLYYMGTESSAAKIRKLAKENGGRVASMKQYHPAEHNKILFDIRADL